MAGHHIRELHSTSFYPYGYDNLNVVELQGLASGANSHLTFGHYEQAIGHFRRYLAEHIGMLQAQRNCSDRG